MLEGLQNVTIETTRKNMNENKINIWTLYTINLVNIMGDRRLTY